MRSVLLVRRMSSRCSDAYVSCFKLSLCQHSLLAFSSTSTHTATRALSTRAVSFSLYEHEAVICFLLQEAYQLQDSSIHTQSLKSGGWEREWCSNSSQTRMAWAHTHTYSSAICFQLRQLCLWHEADSSSRWIRTGDEQNQWGLLLWVDQITYAL